MAVYVYSGDSRQDLARPVANVFGVQTPVRTIWAYDGADRSLVWASAMMTLSAAPDRWDRATLSWSEPAGGADGYRVYRSGLASPIYAGPAMSVVDPTLRPQTTYRWRVEALRAGAVVSGASATATTPAAAVALTAAAIAADRIDLTWTDPQGVDAWLLESSIGRVGTFPAATLAATHTNLTAGTAYSYVLHGMRSGVSALTATLLNARTPGPATQQRTWTGTAQNAASYYRKDGVVSRRTDSSGLAHCYYGFYDTTWSEQFSQVRWDIPAEIRNCVSVDRVELSWTNDWHFWNTGGQVSLVAHHNTNLNVYGGNTGALLSGGTQMRFAAPKPGSLGGLEWVDITRLNSSGRPSIAEEINKNNMQGIGLVAAASGQSGYGYAATQPRLRITYTVRVA